jgi:N-acetylmuramoyl-L-alanine amidase
MIASGDIRRIAVGLCAAFALVASSAWAEDKEASARSGKTACHRDEFRVILDVGHTIDSPGAYSARGAPEYRFNFFLTRQIELQLKEAGFSKTVVMITQGKARPSLAARIARANGLGGHLLISVHHDSVPQQFKDDWKYEGKEFEFSDRFKGHSIFVSMNNHDVKASMQFGKLLGQALKTRGLDYTPHYKEKFMGQRQRPLLDALTGVYSYDKLLVLKQTRMPAVLFEAGNIVNREEELELLSEERQLVTSAAVTEAVDAFCAARTGTKTHLDARRSSIRYAGKKLRPSTIQEASALRRR